MAASLAPFVPVQEYLTTGAYAGMEYLDGRLHAKKGSLEENPVVAFRHGRLQGLIASWFDQHEDKWKVIAAVKVHTRISASIYRLPDVVVVENAPEGDQITEPPLIVIEVLSPNDTPAETERRVRDYRLMGIRNIWIIDPETRSARTTDGAAWTAASRLGVIGTPIYLNVPSLFARLEKKRP